MKVSIKQYAQTLHDMTDGKSEQEVLAVVAKFAEQLKKDGQLKNAAKIMEKFGEIYNAKNGIVVAEVVTRQTPESLNVKEIENFIKKKYKAEKVEMNVMVDEKIKGGIVIRVGDEILDGSVSGQLKKLQNILSK